MKNLGTLLSMSLILILLSSSCIVSKKEYVLKEDEARECSENLAGQVEENKALRDELSTCQGGII
jgi:hypothetical protein